MAETVREDIEACKKTLAIRENPNGSATVLPVRNPQNPVKIRAEKRASELGTTLHEVYIRSGVARNYLTYEPKTGWRQDRLRLVAATLQWTVDELLYGPEDARVKRERTEQDSNLLEVAIEIAVDLLRDDANDGPSVGRLSRMIYQSLQLHVGSGEVQPSRQSLLIWGRLLIAALTAPSTRS